MTCSTWNCSSRTHWELTKRKAILETPLSFNIKISCVWYNRHRIKAKDGLVVIHLRQGHQYQPAPQNVNLKKWKFVKITPQFTTTITVNEPLENAPTTSNATINPHSQSVRQNQSTERAKLPPRQGNIVKHPRYTPDDYRRRSHGLIEPKTPAGYMKIRESDSPGPSQRVNRSQDRNRFTSPTSNQPSVQAPPTPDPPQPSQAPEVLSAFQKLLWEERNDSNSPLSSKSPLKNFGT